MSVEAGLIAFAGLTCLSLAMKKHRAKVRVRHIPSSTVTRTMGWLLLGVSFVVAIFAFGPAMGVVAWMGQLSVAGAILVLMMSRRPGIAPYVAGLLLAGAAVTTWL